MRGSKKYGKIHIMGMSVLLQSGHNNNISFKPWSASINSVFVIKVNTLVDNESND